MTQFIDVVTIILAGMLFSGMVFFAFFMAPLIFIKLPQQIAGNFIREVFPWYYLIFGLLSLVLSVLLVAHQTKWLVFIILACVFAFVFARQWLMPRINIFRDAALNGDISADKTFKKMHRYSVLINTLQMVGIFIVYYLLIN